MEVKEGEKYTGDELEELGYKCPVRAFIFIFNDGVHPLIAVDIGNDNWKIVKVLDYISQDIVELGDELNENV